MMLARACGPTHNALTNTGGMTGRDGLPSHQVDGIGGARVTAAVSEKLTMVSLFASKKILFPWSKRWAYGKGSGVIRQHNARRQRNEGFREHVAPATAGRFRSRMGAGG